MGIAFVDSAHIRALIVMGITLVGTCSPALAEEPPPLVPLDAAAAADDIVSAKATSPHFTFDRNPNGVETAVFTADRPNVLVTEKSGEKSPIAQVGGQKVTGVVRVGHEAAPPVEAHVQSKGTSSDKVKKAALTELPLNRLNPQQLARVQTLLDEVGYFRRLPTTVFAAEPDVYSFFIRHPDVAVSIWRVMGISEMKMWQTGPNEYEGDSGDGSTGTIDVLFRSPELNLLLCEGQYQSPIMKKPIKARSLILLKSTFNREADGTFFVTHRADMYVTFPSQTVETAAKVLSPVTGPLADRTFTEMSLFIRMMSLAMTRRPAWVDQIAGQMEGVADLRKNQLRQVMITVHNNERKRLGLPPMLAKTPAPPVALPAGAGEGAVSSTSPTYGPAPLVNSNGTRVMLKAKTVSSSAEKTAEALDESSRSDVNSTSEFDVSGEGSASDPKPEPKIRVEPGYQVIPKRQKP